MKVLVKVTLELGESRGSGYLYPIAENESHDYQDLRAESIGDCYGEPNAEHGALVKVTLGMKVEVLLWWPKR